MKKVLSFALALILTGSALFTSISSIPTFAEKEKSTPMLDCYSTEKERIISGDSVNLSFTIVDENFSKTTKMQDAYIKMADDSAFSYSGSSPFVSDTAEYKEEKGGVEISFSMDGLVYSVGDKLSLYYGFKANGEPYQNLISFTVEETTRKVDKTEGEIKDYGLIAEDQNRNLSTERITIDSTVQNGRDMTEITGSDPMVLNAQKWLNARYTGKHGYTPIPEDGTPGTRVAEAFVTGLQIDLGIAEPTGIFGEATKAAFDSQVGTLQKGSTDTGDKQYVTMLQHAMYCKGYDPTAVTGTFGDGTEDGLIKMKEDAGFQNSDGVVDAMWMKAVLNSDAYIVVNKGDNRIREAQQYLNRKYYNYFGIKPCDGHYSRETNEAEIYAWQCEEGLDTATANGHFGPTTKKLCPNLPYDSRYPSDTLKNFIRLLQYSLYFNEVDDRSKLPFNDTYGLQVRTCVLNFQKFMCLPDESGNADVGTIMSLMVSTGDPDRAAKGCDCATQLDSAKAQSLHNAGYEYVGRYLSGNSASGPKNLTIDELVAIANAGLKTFPIYQDGATKPEYFNQEQGLHDGKKAAILAEFLRIPHDTTIYFAVDYDFMDYQVTSQVIPYFGGIVNAIGKNYKVGIYGSRNICTRVSEIGLSTSSFVSDMSSGYSGNYGYPMPSNWAFDQYNEYDFPAGFGLDKDAVSGRDSGFSIDVDNLYNRTSAREYMERWHEDRNPKYKSFDADCANFVSQCLNSSGFPMNSKWYNLNIFNSSNALKDIIQNTEDENGWTVTDSWSVAREQYKFFKDYKNGFTVDCISEINIDKNSNIADVLAQAKNEGYPIQVGDVLCWHENGSADSHHSSIISEINNDMIYYAQHTIDCIDKPLEEGLGEEYVSVIRIRN